MRVIGCQHCSVTQTKSPDEVIAVFLGPDGGYAMNALLARKTRMCGNDVSHKNNTAAAF